MFLFTFHFVGIVNCTDGFLNGELALHSLNKPNLIRRCYLSFYIVRFALLIFC